MKLPPELRSLVYTFALQDFVDEVEANPAATLPWQLPNHGVPALLKIATLRHESSDAMLLPARAHHERHKRLRDEFFKNSPRRLDVSIKEALDYANVYHRTDTVESLSIAIDQVHREENALSKVRGAFFEFEEMLDDDPETHEIRGAFSELEQRLEEFHKIRTGSSNREMPLF